ncbi:hypothetical protein GCM10010346_20610 [Streptomyces chryseus]|uniref:Uncharacterized protein n=1 Tax=Streptomyces chryseus TaxID=68186 RepID=A0ABQ3DI38_9ACTN|nr:hypothetical protein GCM10010346_20610 [Streptomyces chryseus]
MPGAACARFHAIRHPMGQASKDVSLLTPPEEIFRAHPGDQGIHPDPKAVRAVVPDVPAGRA